jgi:hypothetical protein
MNPTRWLPVALILIAAPARAQTSYPMVTRVEPAAVQRGQSAEATIAGLQNLSGATGLMFEGSGLSGEVIDDAPAGKPEPKPGRRRRNDPNNAIRARIAAAPDAPLGPREVRVVTPRGVSSVGQVVVVADPVAPESDDKANDVPAGAQELALPAVATGTIGKVEDVDWFAFRAEAGQTVVLSLWGNRLEDKIHDLQTHLDPLVSVQDAAGRELAVGDNYYFADPLLAVPIKESGTYRVQVRDSTYAGNPNWAYVLHITAGPYATSVFPMAVNPGTSAELRAKGYNLDEARPVALDVPADARPGPISLPLPTDRGATPPVPLVATTLPLAVEADDSAHEPIEQAQALALPSALSGRLGGPNDVDAYRFEAKKGDVFSLEIQARRVGSQADPVLRVVDAKGKQVIEVDDAYGKDPRVQWTTPADGAYAVEIRDLHSRGGDGFGYVLLAERARPDFVLTCDPDKLNVGPGARVPLFVKVARLNGFQGPVAATVDGLPPGLSATPLTIPESMTQGLIVVSAAADARPAAGPFALVGRADGPDGPIEHAAQPQQEIYLPGGGRGLYPVQTLAASATEPSDITVEATPAELTLKPGESATIDVTVTRRQGFEQPVNLAVDLSHLGQVYASPLPPGVVFKEAGSKTLLGPKETQGKIVLEARPDAKPCEGMSMAVMGHVSINFVVKTAFCSAPIRVKVEAK